MTSNNWGGATRASCLIHLFSFGFCPFVNTAAVKPSKQTQILLDTMSKSADEEKTFMTQVMDQFDLLFSKVNDIGEMQQQMKVQMDIRGAAMDHYSAEQHMIAQQVKANGAAVAQLTMRQFDTEPIYDDDEDNVSVVFDEKESFHNVFAKEKQAEKPESSKTKKPFTRMEYKAEPKNLVKGSESEKLPNQAMPKMLFPKLDGTDPKIWRDNCQSYFELYKLPEGMWITAAHLHFEGNAAKWYQAYKQNHSFKNWDHFCQIVEEEFGSDDLRAAMNELLDLKQVGAVEDYTSKFQDLQYTITMHAT